MIRIGYCCPDEQAAALWCTEGNDDHLVVFRDALNRRGVEGRQWWRGRWLTGEVAVAGGHCTVAAVLMPHDLAGVEAGAIRLLINFLVAVVVDAVALFWLWDAGGGNRCGVGIGCICEVGVFNVRVEIFRGRLYGAVGLGVF